MVFWEEDFEMNKWDKIFLRAKHKWIHSNFVKNVLIRIEVTLAI